ncbi:MAG: NAD(P)H-hydrate dehydratase [Candidatus Omnitrophica bacterium]|nr:NAD(P)H-hydrate dehydratase [Candidatus Omnitrophota bacterium]MDD5653634.1 NAD(P)H-hydrate dehydratase [Candidatus Omnitrophota bacterium]
MLHRKPDSQKRDFGHVFILAGSSRFSGAAVLAGNAAMRSGAGLVTLGIPQSLNSAVIKIKFKEVMTLPLKETKSGVLSSSAFVQIKDFLKQIDALVIGPGLGREAQTQNLVRKVISLTDKPIVIDADGLNALVGHLDLLRITQNGQRATILTPHPGEMARLLGVSVNKIQLARKKIAQKFSRDYKVTLVLKGNRSIVSNRSGLYINQTGNPGMATAGSGDVLSGMIASFLGQGLDAFSAVKYAVYLHGLAGDLAAKEKTQISLIASDIIDKIPEAVKRSS